MWLRVNDKLLNINMATFIDMVEDNKIRVVINGLESYLTLNNTDLRKQVFDKIIESINSSNIIMNVE